MNEDEPTGIPTRAIHESYLTLQRAHQDYRRARDRGDDTHHEQGALQDAVLTFYELLRPHLKHETGLSEYWNGELPDYTGWNFDSAAEARAYIRDKGTGVYQIQRHTLMDDLQQRQQVLTDGGNGTEQPQSFEDWHNLLGLSWERERLISWQAHDDGVYFQVFRCAVLPLRQLDNWQTTIRRERTNGGGFMAGQTSTTEHREFVNEQKLITGKRLLVEAADKLGALSQFDASKQRTEITREDLEKVEQWRQEQI